MGCPCETRTSTCRSFATISSGLYRFLAITVLLDVKDIPQVGPLQWGRITIIDTNALPYTAATARWSAANRGCGQPRRGKPRTDRASQMMVEEQASIRSFYLPFERTHH